MRYVEGDPADRVLVALRRIGGAVATSELAYKTGLTEVEVVDALTDLEARGMVVPASWTLGPEAGR